MTKFVEQCAGIVKRKKRGLTGLRLCKIHHIVDERLLPGIELVARLQRTHPCARALGGAGKIVA